MLAGAGLTAVLYYSHRIIPNRVEVSRTEVEIPDLAPAFDGYRIAQISDLHADRWMTPARLSARVRLVNEQNPDLVVVTGDLLTDPNVGKDPNFARELSRLESADGTLAILGNYDYDSDARVARALLAKAGIRELANDVFSVKRGDETLYIGGADDVWHGRANLGEVFRKLPGGEPLIMLVHEPDFADETAKSGRVALQLSGHTHGGQVRLPLYGPVLRPKYGIKYPSGTYRVGEMTLHVNRGIGMFPPRLRFRCRPEISVIVLRRTGEDIALEQASG